MMLERRTALALASFGAVFTMTSKAGAAEAPASTLKAGQFLTVGSYLSSSNRRFFAVMQSDGNFCVYKGSDPDHRKYFGWGSIQQAGYRPTPGEYFAIMQEDGNLCVYKGARPGKGQVFLWGSINDCSRQPASGSCFAVMQDDGNLCVYRESPPGTDHEFLWGSAFQSNQCHAPGPGNAAGAAKR